MSSEKLVHCEVACGVREYQHVVSVSVPVGTSAAQAVVLSGIAVYFPQCDWRAPPLAVYGELIDAHTPVQAGDRIEVLRPLLIDPMTRRRERAATPTREPTRI